MDLAGKRGKKKEVVWVNFGQDGGEFIK